MQSLKYFIVIVVRPLLKYAIIYSHVACDGPLAK
jgi:hypothetical protein